jgi:hypothetical protein
MPRSDASGSKRFHGWTNRRMRRLGASFVWIIRELAGKKIVIRITVFLEMTRLFAI